MSEYIAKYGSENIFDDYLRELYDTASKKSFIRRHGKVEGEKKYEEYVQFHKYKNTFEYKQNVHGWSKEEYDSYNKSRAMTKELCVFRHGETLGEKIWSDYVEKQKTAGCSKDYFISKYGQEKGIQYYKTVNKKKSNHNNHYGGTSKAASDFCMALYNEIKNINLPVYFYNKKLNKKEYWVYSKENKRYFFIDFCIPDLNIAIEFNGDFWHANPNIFEAKDVVIGEKLAEDIWAFDAYKLHMLKQHDLDVLVVWQSDYTSRKPEILEELKNEIITRI